MTKVMLISCQAKYIKIMIDIGFQYIRHNSTFLTDVCRRIEKKTILQQDIGYFKFIAGYAESKFSNILLTNEYKHHNILTLVHCF